MNTRGLAAIAAALILAAACVRPAQPGHVWNLWGTVTGVSATQISVKHKSGRVVTLEIDEGTVFTNGKRPAGPEALAMRARVSVDIEVLPDGRQRARIVRIVWGGAGNAGGPGA